jgi:hypothetical protein
MVNVWLIFVFPLVPPLKLSPTVAWLAGLVRVLRIGLPGQLVAPGETFSVTVTPAWVERIAANKPSAALSHPDIHLR